MNFIELDVYKAVERGLLFLIQKQEKNGSFVDFELPPGASDGWITAFIAVAIDEAAKIISVPGCNNALDRAAKFLLNNMRATGWGYNSKTATDADSTSFAVRAIGRAGINLPEQPEVLLRHYIDECGHGHTFLDPDRMGSWAGRHADITPSIGLALIEVNASLSLRNKVIDASLTSRDESGIWKGFWWLQPYYATWLNLKWLRTSCALTPDIAYSAKQGSLSLNADLSVMDEAALLGILLEESSATDEAVLVETVYHLMKMQFPNGNWPSSLCLILPQSWEVNNKKEARKDNHNQTCYADTRTLFTTAVVVQMLSFWYHNQQCSLPQLSNYQVKS
jgi:hypothetical protein